MLSVFNFIICLKYSVGNCVYINFFDICLMLDSFKLYRYWENILYNKLFKIRFDF